MIEHTKQENNWLKGGALLFLHAFAGFLIGIIIQQIIFFLARYSSPYVGISGEESAGLLLITPVMVIICLFVGLRIGIVKARKKRKNN